VLVSVDNTDAITVGMDVWRSGKRSSTEIGLLDNLALEESVTVLGKTRGH